MYPTTITKKPNNNNTKINRKNLIPQHNSHLETFSLGKKATLLLISFLKTWGTYFFAPASFGGLI